MDIKIIAGLVGTALFSMIVIALYNQLIRLRYGVRNAWSDIDVLLKKRHELVPNLVETVKGYATHEQETLIKVTQTRSAAIAARSPAEKAHMENKFGEVLKNLFALAEAYPDLKANVHFKDLMTHLKEIEDNIEHARRFYNAAVNRYNVATAVFPTNILASAFSFKEEEFFALAEDSPARQPAQVDFQSR